MTLSSAQILVVDDEQDILPEYQEFFKFGGFATRTCASPLEAVKLVLNTSADVLRQISDPFFSTKPSREGTGLGLSISYGIIRDLGGVIRAKSGHNGARFTIELPLAEVKAVFSQAGYV